MYPMVNQGVCGFISNTTLKAVGSIAHRIQVNITWLYLLSLFHKQQQVLGSMLSLRKGVILRDKSSFINGLIT